MSESLSDWWEKFKEKMREVESKVKEKEETNSLPKKE